MIFFLSFEALINEKWVTGSVSAEDKLRTYLIRCLLQVCALDLTLFFFFRSNFLTFPFPDISGPQLHSDFTKKIEADLCDHPSFDQILMQVAEKRWLKLLLTKKTKPTSKTQLLVFAG